ncbi:hypothetical protein [Campylobacter estrildidarum]|uniref:Uncharacterized protein n=1 Tax=Campylobacter estrildidarum TaxID=2510189 RepID=A0A4U7BG51_9BACT|nr:hypothetical protein [Campylobacter estrildidarum]TKX30648.1 hypothetical protein CQA69_05280 [Campylobacter estrildidarum]
MKITIHISDLPKAPNMQEPVNFDAEADRFVAALPPFGKELNALIEELNGFIAFIQSSSENIQNMSNLFFEDIKKERIDTIFEIELESFKIKQKTLNTTKLEFEKYTNECIERINSQKFSALQTIQDNESGADYIAICQNIAHVISLERHLFENNLIKLKRS